MITEPDKVLSCLSADRYHAVLTFQPPSRYWIFQTIESGIFLILAAILIAITIRLILHYLHQAPAETVPCTECGYQQTYEVITARTATRNCARPVGARVAADE